jgi:uncharacterized membrane protein YoaK (UPF0700 family)
MLRGRLARPAATSSRARATRASLSEAKLSLYEDLGLALLSSGSGCTDVLAFIKLGGVFTSAMTGNMALLAIALGRGHLLAASRSLCALLGFVLGVVLAAAVCNPSPKEDEDRRRVLRRLLPLELLFLVSCAALCSATAGSVQGALLYAVIALSALGMGIQAIAARASNSSGINTVVFTTNLVSILVPATRALARLPPAGTLPARTGPQVHAFIAYGVGAALGAFLVYHWPESVVWIPVAAVLLASGLFQRAARAARRAVAE